MATRSTACTHPNPNPNPGHRIRTVALLKLCTSMSEVHQAHAGIIKVGLAHDISAVNAIIEIAAVSDSGRNLLYAQSIFERTPKPTQFAKNLLLRGHSQGQNPRAAISLYAQMLTHGFEINVFAFTFLLQAAARSLSAEEGKQIHGQILKSGENFDAHLATSALRFYSEIGDLNSARGVFEWNRRFVGSWNVMIDGYMKAGETDSARDLFDEMPHKTVISWTAMICGYAHSGRFKEAVDTFRAMQGAGIRPDGQTIVSLLPSVSRLGHLGLGKWVHSYIKSSGAELNPFLGSALIDMYAKCGSIEDAIAMFHKVGPARRNVVVWNAMIGGLAMHGRGTEALRLFNEMLMSGFRPTGVTFVGVLRACGQVGMVDEGMKYFSAMKTVYGIDPVVEHYGCVVDLLSRAGRLEEAEKLMNTKRNRGEPDVVILKILLAACKVRGNVVIGERVGRELLELAPGDSSCYVLLSNLYASVGLWENANRVRNLMRERGVEKIAGCSAIELDNEVHEFLAGDVSHPRIKEIYAKLEEIAQSLKLEGYRADTNVVLANIDEEEKETAVDRHSEKLAIAFGLINTESGGTIRIVKNLRVCVDCHAATKLISRIYDREIIARDQNRFHHFRKGSCSCNDYW